jgi:ribosomal protein L37AE/L43A
MKFDLPKTLEDKGNVRYICEFCNYKGKTRVWGERNVFLCERCGKLIQVVKPIELPKNGISREEYKKMIKVAEWV